ncbi:GNAT family N-acetyltransferase [Streptomyces sp. DSM 44917]|uniref:GNAT family N-acetyltransferase n=1 Tax=Streptomyces boetiae TaxID=3075541 RepID=A0ABU2LDK0_9ACTN|nr:GNAT family N-acetyltransferase [Streptomyces sp. DSM 44917]MDT0309367.1 GNAT family N-acetyltransferase [Streptomyces sp. DSM 44917]
MSAPGWPRSAARLPPPTPRPHARPSRRSPATSADRTEEARSMPVTVRREEGADAVLAALDSLLPLYAEVYAEPPYHEGPEGIADFIHLYHHQARQRPGVRVAFAQDDGQTVGFAFGFRLPADTAWWTGALTPLPPDLTREDGRRTFAVVELGVRKPWRRRGIARRLHAALLEGQPVERATLTVRPEPEAAPARAAYTAWGYRPLTATRPWPEAPLYTAMILPLQPAS